MANDITELDNLFTNKYAIMLTKIIYEQELFLNLLFILWAYVSQLQLTIWAF